MLGTEVVVTVPAPGDNTEITPNTEDIVKGDGSILDNTSDTSVLATVTLYLKVNVNKGRGN